MKPSGCTDHQIAFTCIYGASLALHVMIAAGDSKGVAMVKAKSTATPMRSILARISKKAGEKKKSLQRRASRESSAEADDSEAKGSGLEGKLLFTGRLGSDKVVFYAAHHFLVYPSWLSLKTTILQCNWMKIKSRGGFEQQA